ncbi:MAG: hypothetical protein NTV82_13440 [Candidatus Aminicenantes bacterium]|nr:hypothetical protein [Candidatus Aminicenantes bacterium]
MLPYRVASWGTPQFFLFVNYHSYIQYLKDFNAALDPIKKTTDLQPDNGNAFYNLAIVYLNLKDNFSAREVYRKLTTIDANLAAKLKPLLP